MEEIYANVEEDKPIIQILTPNQGGPSSSKKRLYVGGIITLGLLVIFLLAGITVLGLHSQNKAADFSTIKDNLTELLQTSNDKLSSMTEERDLLKTNLNETTEERDLLKTSLNERTEERDLLKTSLNETTEERDLLKTSLNERTEERDLLKTKFNERTEELTRLQKLTQNKACPAGWTMFNSSCYLLSTTSGSWYQARADCRKRGADLVVIDSSEKQTFLKRFTHNPTWIGLTDREKEGSWKWVDGTPLTLRYWAKNEPNNDGGNRNNGEEDCGHLRTDHYWNDANCKARLLWICEKVPT